MKHVTMFAKGLDQNKTADIRGIAGAKADQTMRDNAAGIGWWFWVALPVSQRGLGIGRSSRKLQKNVKVCRGCQSGHGDI